ncbi:MAG: hypothetical protein FWG64_14630 [Firmicutes bacterium]|nr:hypothetical protein [Bacillota bacterium]
MKKILLTMLLILAITACAENAPTGTTTGEANESATAGTASNDLLTVEVFSARANYQGIQSGFFAHLIREQFNIELNIIAPNVAGGGDMLFQTRSAAGHIGDLIIVGAGGGVMQEMVTGGLLLDISPHMGNSQNLNNFMRAIESLNSPITQDGIFGTPMEVSSQPATNTMEGLEPTFGPYLRWDLYAELGYPEMNSLDDLLDVLEQMQNMNPTTDDGLPVYAISLFPDWDSEIMMAARQPAAFFGYGDNVGYLLLQRTAAIFKEY